MHGAPRSKTHAIMNELIRKPLFNSVVREKCVSTRAICEPFLLIVQDAQWSPLAAHRTHHSARSRSRSFHGPAPRSPLHRLSIRLRRSRSTTSTQYSLPGATQLLKCTYSKFRDSSFCLRSCTHSSSHREHHIEQNPRHGLEMGPYQNAPLDHTHARAGAHIELARK